MVLVDTKSFLFGHGTLKISLQTENHLNGWLSVHQFIKGIKIDLLKSWQIEEFVEDQN